MNCNICPFKVLCQVPKSTASSWYGNVPIYHTIPSNIEDCPLYRLLLKELGKQEEIKKDE